MTRKICGQARPPRAGCPRRDENYELEARRLERAGERAGTYARQATTRRGGDETVSRLDAHDMIFPAAGIPSGPYGPDMGA